MYIWPFKAIARYQQAHDQTSSFLRHFHFCRLVREVGGEHVTSRNQPTNWASIFLVIFCGTTFQAAHLGLSSAYWYEFQLLCVLSTNFRVIKSANITISRLGNASRHLHKAEGFLFRNSQIIQTIRQIFLSLTAFHCSPTEENMTTMEPASHMQSDED